MYSTIGFFDKVTQLNRYNKINLTLVEAKDKAPDSDFYFKIESFYYHTTQYDFESKDSITYKVSRKPKSDKIETEVDEELSDWVTINKFNEWINIINQYNKIDINRKDPIISFYEDEFYNNFKIVDEDADINPFNLKQQLALNEHTDFIIEIFKESNDDLSNQIVNETVKLKNELTISSKSKVFKQLCKIWALARKKGLDILKLILSKGFDKLVELSISRGFHEIIDLF